MNQKQVTQIVVGLVTFLATKYGFNLDTSVSDTITLFVTGVVNHFMHSDPPPTGAVSTNTANKSNSTILALLILALPVCFTGCAANNTVKNTDKALGLSDTSVSAAMRIWGDYVKLKHPPVSQELQVRAAFEKVQAIEVLIADENTALAQTGGTNIVSSLLTNHQAEAQAFSDLINLMRSFGVSI